MVLGSTLSRVILTRYLLCSKDGGFCDYRINLFPLTLSKLNLSIAYFAVQKSTERIVYSFPSTVFK